MTTTPPQPKRILDDSVIRATGYLIDGANMIPPPPSRVKQIANAGHVWRMSTRDSANSRDRERLGRVRYFHVLLSNVKWQRETGSGDKGYREIRPRVAIQQECRIKWPSEKSNLKKIELNVPWDAYVPINFTFCLLFNFVLHVELPPSWASYRKKQWCKKLGVAESYATSKPQSVLVHSFSLMMSTSFSRR